ncbi:hypothetical protein V496_01937 [Pseudogymnoascus sp. VKM F-4515 (FW-2607)]|nr:hypothetical protein V496_01937 [Pseudogymnoascus sp. VKM F-4515 (FW-2607)]
MLGNSPNMTLTPRCLGLVLSAFKAVARSRRIGPASKALASRLHAICPIRPVLTAAVLEAVVPVNEAAGNG